MRAISYMCGLLVLALAGCASVPPPPQKVVVRGDNYCKIAERFRYSKRDTRESINQARKHNAKYNRAC